MVGESIEYGTDSLTFFSQREPEEIIHFASLLLAGEGGWTIVSRDAREVYLSAEVGVGCGLVTLALLLLGILRGVLYLLFGKKTVTIAVTSTRIAEGSETTLVWSDRSECNGACQEFAEKVLSQEPEPAEDEPERPRTRPLRRRRRIRRAPTDADGEPDSPENQTGE
jgi:hypothetical protein